MGGQTRYARLPSVSWLPLKILVLLLLHLGKGASTNQNLRILVVNGLTLLKWLKLLAGVSRERETSKREKRGTREGRWRREEINVEDTRDSDHKELIQVTW